MIPGYFNPPLNQADHELTRVKIVCVACMLTVRAQFQSAKPHTISETLTIGHNAYITNTINITLI